MGLGLGSSNGPDALLKEEDARRIVDPYKALLRQIFTDAFNAMLERIKGAEHIFGSRSRANMLHDLICEKAKALLNDENVHTRKIRGIFTVFFDSADLRFKKLDKKRRASNVRTQQSERYTAQLKLAGFRTLTRLTAGYVLNDVQTALHETVVVLHFGRSVKYFIDLGDTVAGQSTMPLISPQQETPKTPRRRRVSAKRDIAKTKEQKQ
jgi:hypothetical protein